MQKKCTKVVFIEVHVDAPYWLKEAEYIQSLADATSPGSTPEIGAIVAYAPVEQGIAENILLFLVFPPAFAV
jgi:hypothetical protein